MATPDEFIDWLRSLPDTRVELHDSPGAVIDLMGLAKDLPGKECLHAWWKGKHMSPHLNRNVALTVLSLNPPENIRAAMLLLMM